MADPQQTLPHPIAKFVADTGCDYVGVIQHESANGKRIGIVEYGYHGGKTIIGVSPQSARRLGKVLIGIADAMDPDQTELPDWQVRI